MDLDVHSFFTIGHSTHPIVEFADILAASNVQVVVDVRTVPRSRTIPQYNRDSLPQALDQFGVEYEHIAALGGLRGHDREIPPAANAFWRNRSFHNYADYAMSRQFHEGLNRL